MGARRPVTTAGRDARRGGRHGMTLMETLIAIVILASVLIGLGEFMAQFAHTTKVSALQQRGLDLATDRIDSVEHSQTYVSIDSMAAVENIAMDSTVYKRTTLVQHIGGGPTDTMDYRTVTVSVALPSVPAPVRKTTIIAAF
jgi:prepilin-type N-terminal cleavage/methylation domain-containing protein